MRTKKVNRYYCEFCKKANCSGASISKHERGCTLNPNRQCGMCKMVKDARALHFVQLPLSALIAMLPDPDPHKREIEGANGFYDFDESLSEAIASVLPALREAAGDCPACILAAIRQRGIPVPVVHGFDFKNECQEIWNGINARGYERDAAYA